MVAVGPRPTREHARSEQGLATGNKGKDRAAQGLHGLPKRCPGPTS